MPTCFNIHPPKFNMKPENYGFQMDVPFPGTLFSGSIEFVCSIDIKSTKTPADPELLRVARHFQAMRIVETTNMFSM